MVRLTGRARNELSRAYVCHRLRATVRAFSKFANYAISCVNLHDNLCLQQFPGEETRSVRGPMRRVRIRSLQEKKCRRSKGSGVSINLAVTREKSANYEG